MVYTLSIALVVCAVALAWQTYKRKRIARAYATALSVVETARCEVKALHATVAALNKSCDDIVARADISTQARRSERERHGIEVDDLKFRLKMVTAELEVVTGVRQGVTQ